MKLEFQSMLTADGAVGVDTGHDACAVHTLYRLFNGLP